MCVWNHKGCDVGVKCGFRYVATLKNCVNTLSKWLVIMNQKLIKSQSMSTYLVERCNTVFLVSCSFTFCITKVTKHVVVFLMNKCSNYMWFSTKECFISYALGYVTNEVHYFIRNFFMQSLLQLHLKKYGMFKLSLSSWIVH